MLPLLTAMSLGLRPTVLRQSERSSKHEPARIHLNQGQRKPQIRDTEI
jgi:hypothetical protein